jgi:hypothetical protein
MQKLLAKGSKLLTILDKILGQLVKELAINFTVQGESLVITAPS